MAERDLSDYVEVSERIQEFRDKYPDGSLRPWNHDEPWRFVQALGYEKNGDQAMQSFVVVVAAAYRTPDDPSPGVGMAWEVFPGRTPYTRGSELQNAETSAWGRAIIAVGAADAKRGIASREEVQNRRAERTRGPVPDGENPWHDSPAGTLPEPIPGSIPPEDYPGSIDGKQRDALMGRFDRLGVKDRSERLAQTIEIIARPIGSANDLSLVEAGVVLRELDGRLARAKIGHKS